MSGKIIRLEAVSDKYLYGIVSDFNEQSDNAIDNNMQYGTGTISAVEKIEE